MAPPYYWMLVASTKAAGKRLNPRRRRIARAHHVSFFAWLRRWWTSRR